MKFEIEISDNKLFDALKEEVAKASKKQIREVIDSLRYGESGRALIEEFVEQNQKLIAQNILDATVRYAEKITRDELAEAIVSRRSFMNALEKWIKVDYRNDTAIQNAIIDRTARYLVKLTSSKIISQAAEIMTSNKVIGGIIDNDEA